MLEKLAELNKPYGPAPYRRPRDAATLILLDQSGTVPRLLMGRRSEQLAFMPGMYVFPGGRTERSDLTAPRTGVLHRGDAERLIRGMGRTGTPRRAEALIMSAIRETQEETGLLIGKAGAAQSSTRSPAWRTFLDRGILPNLSAIRFVARAITPPGRVRRFDTRFFVADAGHVANPDELIANPAEELDEVRWVGLDALESIRMPTITEAILDLLAERLREDPALDRDLPVPFIRAENRRYVLTRD
tara:strand:- start:5088 stop:5822 length:735 start_codon:yes stop_codon:yes gene_type:complete